LSITQEQSGALPGRTDTAWYDEFYKTPQIGRLAPWYRFVLPELRATLTPQTRLVELGCGQAHVLRLLAKENLLPEENITGVDQSQTAIEYASKHLPKARMMVGDLYELKNVEPEAFDVCLLMETVEHLEEPEIPLANIRRIIKPGGLLYLSFPNYLHFPWLLVRILAEKLNHPNWIVLQPVDKIYTVLGIIRLLDRAGFRFVKGIGSSYGPPVFYPLETDGMTRLLNTFRFWRFSFHPILVFSKPASGR
jgi:2-polyprenyl-3-methyl-5-hydroxy-6-metoxy-1,4-benzoquinol methylase